jgi:hypothetical protein
VKHVKWLGMKTSSFWYMCLGGTQLMTLDVHNLRQIGGLGIHVPEEHYRGEQRGDGRTIVTIPSRAQYERIEADTLALLTGCAAVKNCRGPDGALVSALFWVTGAKATRGYNPLQHDMFETPRLSFVSPYNPGTLPTRQRAKKQQTFEDTQVTLFAA